MWDVDHCWAAGADSAWESGLGHEVEERDVLGLVGEHLLEELAQLSLKLEFLDDLIQFSTLSVVLLKT